ncbi:MAG TPA: hypothetical protein VM532_12745 [Burkholderiales bacterium]|jgi:hypothetical protein|nr:hypothetical protein [Burkholderiales bacterium]
MTITIFRINEFEWYAGDCTPEEILAFYMKETGCTKEEATDDDDTLPEALSDEEMDKMIITTEPGNSESTTMTAREYLARMVAEGQQFPCSFASTEW